MGVEVGVGKALQTKFVFFFFLTKQWGRIILTQLVHVAGGDGGGEDG